MNQPDLGLKVTELRQQKGLTQEQLAERCEVSARTIQRIESGEVDPRAYTLHLPSVLEHQAKGLFPWTPPVTLVRGLDAALQRILAEGLEQVWERHAMVARTLREALIARGFTVFGQATSNALVAVEDHRSDTIRTALRTRHNMIVAGGQDQQSGRLIRFGCCGATTQADVDDLLAALDDILMDLA